MDGCLDLNSGPLEEQSGHPPHQPYFEILYIAVLKDNIDPSDLHLLEQITSLSTPLKIPQFEGFLEVLLHEGQQLRNLPLTTSSEPISSTVSPKYTNTHENQEAIS